MYTLRDPNRDKLKGQSVLKEQIKKNLTCRMDDCKNSLTMFDGPGRLDRLHTLHRKWVCDDCGVDVSEQVRMKYPGMEEKDPVLFNRLCRNRIIGDHQVRQADGGDDSEDNIRSLCLNCNSDKTIINEDWRRGEKTETEDLDS